MIETPKAESSIITRGLPKTGQSSIYVAGDDGTYQAGWRRGRTNANNRPRFISKTIGGHTVVIDRATGLWWAEDSASINNSGIALMWSAGIQYPTGRSYAGKSDWRIPNIQEMISIINFEANPAMYDLFNFGFITFWTSTTYFISSELCWVVSIDDGSIGREPKTNSSNIFCCRGGV